MAHDDKLEKKHLKSLHNAAAFLPLFLVLSFCAYLFTRALSVDKAVRNYQSVSAEEKAEFDTALDLSFPERHENLHRPSYPIPDTLSPASVNAGAAILVNADTGDILFEKNADEMIPPASMTKLFLIYSVLQKEKAGEVTLDKVIPLDPRSYACNMPPDSSLMFLGEGQIVTLFELLQGLSVCSGNDASYAIAYDLYGSMEKFIEEVNSTIKKLGLKRTHIVESSGYSEDNITTAREMAAFCRIYLAEFPDALKDFHSIKEFTYPKQKNLPKDQWNRPKQVLQLNNYPEKIWTPVEQRNTNKLLGLLDGADGIKTGHIIESGYNLSLTSTRNGERYISVTMKGPGRGMIEGDKFRIMDGKTLHEWAYSNFKEYPEIACGKNDFVIPLYGSERSAMALVPACNRPLAVPKGADIKIEVEVPKYLFGKISLAGSYGRIKYIDLTGKYGTDGIIAEVPLVAEYKSAAANPFIQRCDELILRFLH